MNFLTSRLLISTLFNFFLRFYKILSCSLYHIPLSPYFVYWSVYFYMLNRQVTFPSLRSNLNVEDPPPRAQQHTPFWSSGVCILGACLFELHGPIHCGRADYCAFSCRPDWLPVCCLSSTAS